MVAHCINPSCNAPSHSFPEQHLSFERKIFAASVEGSDGIMPVSRRAGSTEMYFREMDCGIRVEVFRMATERIAQSFPGLPRKIYTDRSGQTLRS